MNDNDGTQRRIEEHIQWCHGERDRLTRELGEYQKGNLSIGTQKGGEPVTQGTVNHISYLQLTIEQLNCVIAARLPPTDRPFISVVEAQIISLAGWVSHQTKGPGSP